MRMRLEPMTDVDDLSELIFADSEEEPEAEAASAAEAEATPDQTAEDDLDLADIFEEPEITSEASEPSLEPDMDIVSLLEDDQSEPPEISDDASVSGDADIDLVKSLMADLTDDSYIDDGDEAGLDFDAEKDDQAKFAEAADKAEAEQDGILDDILDLAMDDEIGQSELIDDLNATRELVHGDQFAGKSSNDDMFVAPDTSTNSLLAIANAAEADAEWAQMKVSAPEPSGFDIMDDRETDVTQTESAMEAEVIDDIFDELEADEDTTQIDLETVIEAQDSAPGDNIDLTEFDEFLEIEEQETPEMPKPAVNPDTILDEVTETAASDAFASLNQAVEEKTAAREAGPAIGELVQDALRPMLKEWLDENLRDIVERAVQKEVKRISSGK